MALEERLKQCCFHVDLVQKKFYVNLWFSEKNSPFSYLNSSCFHFCIEILIVALALQMENMSSF